MNAIVQYFRSSYRELKYKVTWPAWTELEQTTVVVLIASIFLALLLFSMDKILMFFLELFYSLGSNF
jgi:preprotein translocase subunit SecE